VTIYTTAFFGAALIVALTASAAALVLAAPVAQTWDRNPEGLLPHLATVMRAGLIVIAPAVGIAALIGDDAIGVLLSGSFSAGDADTAIVTFVALGGFLVAMLGMQLPLLAAYALSRYNATAVLGAIATGVHVAVCAVAVSIGKIELLGVAASLSGLTTMTLLLWLVHRGGVLGAVGVVVRETALAGGAALVSFGVPGLVAMRLGSGPWDLLAAVVGVVAFALVIHTALPSFAETAHRMLAPVLRVPVRTRARPVADPAATGSEPTDVLP
jgi:peptidoglycan biosynthesis protein MviN/MurJ (putative lipid II flippase)